MKKNLVILFVIIAIITFFAVDVEAQCPMCKMSAESNLKNGGTAGRGLNTGILYMLAAPYLFVGTLAYLWIRNRKKVLEDDAISADASTFSEN